MKDGYRIIFLPNKIKECKKKKKEVVKDLTVFFKNSIKREDNSNHPYDETGKSKYYRTAFLVNPNDKYMSIEVTCFDWSNDLPFYEKSDYSEIMQLFDGTFSKLKSDFLISVCYENLNVFGDCEHCLISYGLAEF